MAFLASLLQSKLMVDLQLVNIPSESPKSYLLHQPILVSILQKFSALIRLNSNLFNQLPYQPQHYSFLQSNGQLVLHLKYLPGG